MQQHDTYNGATTSVIDAGGRYGLHPTWKPFRGELRYVLFEPDLAEADRLRKKYAARANEISVEATALAAAPGTLRIDFFRNRAMSSSAVRNPVSALFTGERLAEVEIVESVDAPAETIDAYCARTGFAVDFLKLDTEGTEYEILSGAQAALAGSVLGVRAEVSFERIFEGKALFGDLHEHLLDRGFYLLNLDYDGRGEYQNEFARIDRRYGVLQGCDAVWMLRRSNLFVAGAHQAARVLKYAVFCLHNHAPDVGIDVLLEARREHDVNFASLEGSRLYRHASVMLHRHFYDLKWVPGQSLKRNASVYEEIMGHPMKTMNDYMQSDELNPD